MKQSDMHHHEPLKKKEDTHDMIQMDHNPSMSHAGHDHHPHDD